MPGGRQRPGRWTVLIASMAIQITTSIVLTALPVLLPFVRAEFHLSLAAAGILVNFPFVGMMLALLVVGMAVDRFGDRPVLVTGGLLAGCAAATGALIHPFWPWLGLLLLAGLGAACSTPAGTVAVRSAFPVSMHGTVMSLRQTAVPIGGLLSALALPSAALAFGWRPALLAVGLAAILAAVTCSLLYREATGMRRPAPPPAPFRRLARPGLVAAGGVGILMMAAQTSIISYTVLFLVQAHHMSVAAAGAVLAVTQLSGATGRVVWGAVSDRLLSSNRAPAVALACLTGGLGVFVLAVLPGDAPMPLLVAAVAVTGFGAMGWNGVQVSLFSELAPPGLEGRAVGFGLTMQQPGIVAAPLVFGLTADLSGGFTYSWLIIGAALVAAAAGVVLIRERSPLAPSTVPGAARG